MQKTLHPADIHQILVFLQISSKEICFFVIEYLISFKETAVRSEKTVTGSVTRLDKREKNR